MDALFPWTPRHMRKAAIARARTEKETSRAGAAEAAQVEAAIERMAERNGFAQAIARQIVMRHQEGGGIP